MNMVLLELFDVGDEGNINLIMLGMHSR